MQQRFISAFAARPPSAFLFMILPEREKKRENHRESLISEETDVSRNVFILLIAFSMTGEKPTVS